MKDCIILTGGGTAGHVIPCITILNDLKKHFKSIYYIGSSGVEKELIEKEKIPFYTISSTKLVRGKILTNLLLPFKLCSAIKEAKTILKKLKPQVVFSKGGYVSVPVVLAAHALKIPIVCHESDLSVGLANKIGAKYSKYICTTFKQTALKYKTKGVYSGSPIDPKRFAKSVKEIKEKYNINTNKKIILITGGSLGSKAINEAIFSCINKLTNKYYVIHLTGKGNGNFNLKVNNYLQLEYSNDLGNLMQIADMVISRAGSNTIFELAYLNKPMLLIPLPKGASRGDQLENAEYFIKNGFAYSLLQENLTSETLLKSIETTLKNSATLKATLAKNEFKNGTLKIIETILKTSN